MITARIPKEIEKRLEELSELTHRSKSFYIREALKAYLEDLEDYYISLERLADKKAKRYTLKEAKKKIGL
ncbi:ribbon-helix-helix protein, CopG family [candidate division WOR-3 bacterium]|nr:ribbon-helix-helix protein, CopG family [candidate division WOR-3 bacterium]